MYLLDANTCIDILTNRVPQAAARLQGCDVSEVALCSVVKAELLYGARKSARVRENLALLELFFAPFRSLPFDDSAAGQYGLLRAELEASGNPIGPNDLMIAAIARRHDCTLVTHNVGEFVRVAGLQVEDWN